MLKFAELMWDMWVKQIASMASNALLIKKKQKHQMDRSNWLQNTLDSATSEYLYSWVLACH